MNLFYIAVIQLLLPMYLYWGYNMKRRLKGMPILASYMCLQQHLTYKRCKKSWHTLLKGRLDHDADQQPTVVYYEHSMLIIAQFAHQDEIIACTSAIIFETNPATRSHNVQFESCMILHNV